MPYLCRAPDYRAWLQKFWFWPHSEWKYILYPLDAFAPRILSSFTSCTMQHYVSMSSTVDCVSECEGKRLSLFSVTESGWSAVSSLCFQAAPPSPELMYFFSLCSSLIYPLVPFADPQSHSCGVTTHQTSSHYSRNNDISEASSLYLWRIFFCGSTALLNVIINLDVLNFFVLF